LPFIRNLLRSDSANRNVKDEEYGTTPLHWACLKGYMELVIELVDDWDAHIDAKDNDGWTPLHCSSSSGHLEIAQELVSAGADIRAVDNDGRLLMHEALREIESDVVKYLLHECYASISDHEDRLPIHAILQDASDTVDGTPLFLRDALEQHFLGTDDVLEIIAFLLSQYPGSLSARN
jgi:hypothetical protein